MLWLETRHFAEFRHHLARQTSVGKPDGRARQTVRPSPPLPMSGLLLAVARSTLSWAVRSRRSIG